MVPEKPIKNIKAMYYEDNQKNREKNEYRNVIELIYYSDKMEIDLEEFLNNIINDFNLKVINDICIKLLPIFLEQNLLILIGIILI